MLDAQSGEIMQVRLTNGELSVRWPNQDTPIPKLTAYW